MRVAIPMRDGRPEPSEASSTPTPSLSCNLCGSECPQRLPVSCCGGERKALAVPGHKTAKWLACPTPIAIWMNTAYELSEVAMSPAHLHEGGLSTVVYCFGLESTGPLMAVMALRISGFRFECHFCPPNDNLLKAACFTPL